MAPPTPPFPGSRPAQGPQAPSGGMGAPGMRAGPPGMGGHGGMNLTEGPIGATLIMFALPLLGTNFIQSLSMTVNAFWVGHAIGPEALAATANSQQLMMLLMGAVMGMGMASSIVVAQAVGAGMPDQIKRVVGASACFFITASFVLAAIGVVAAPAFLSLLNVPPDTRELAIEYLRWTCLSMPVVFFFMFCMMIMRGTGNSRLPFYFSVLSVVVTIVFTPILVEGHGGLPRFGIAGAAMAALLAQTVALVSMLVYLYRTNNPLVLRGSDLRFVRFDPEILRLLTTRGLPMGLQMFIMSGAAMVMMGLVNHHGSMTAAAYAAAMQLWTYVQMPAMALGASVSSMAAQNVGAGRWDRVNKLALTGSAIGMAVTGVFVLIIYALGPIPLYFFLPRGGEVLEIAQEINFHVLWGWIMFAITFVLFGVVRSTGAVWPPMIILFVSLWVVRVPFAQFLDPVLGRTAIWWSFPLGTIGSAALAFLYYRYGDWRSKTMMPFGQRPGMTSGAPSLNTGAPGLAVSETAAAATEAEGIILAQPALLRTGATAIADLQRDIEAMQRRLNLLPGEASSAAH